MPQPDAGSTQGVLAMSTEKIRVKVTETGQMLDVVVLSKRASGIQIVLGEGVHNVKCDLSPTRNGQGYAGTIAGREIVYERTREQVTADLDFRSPTLHDPRRR
jgi:hypothetical protein